jgi:GPH family glycoside/pentoside/hexuronide:cation symporter
MAITFLQSILAYYVEYLYPESFIRQMSGLPLDFTTLCMMALLLTAMVFIPISVLISKKIGKRRTYQICFLVIGAACAAVSAAGHLLPPHLFLGLMVFAGIGVGFSYVAPFAMVPDTVEYDAVRTGERKEGAYYGMWTFISKVGAALSVFVSGLILNWGGYVAKAVQGPKALLAIRLIIGPIPAVIFLGAFVLMRFYPLDEKTYRKIMGQGK